ncbi:MAG: replicative DNA helicase [Phycisphaeraceae bacterium]|nr:replicative DNA helicase [Phycisphaeraceae bacterium]
MTTALPRTDRAPRPPELAKLFDRLPPHALEAEMCLLGSMILDGRFVGEVVQVITSPDDFYQTRHGLIFQALVDLYNRNIPIDLVQLQQKLSDMNALADVGGVQYLVELAEGVPSASSAAYYAKLVRDKAVLRSLIDAASQILQKAYTSGEPAAEQVDLAEREIFRLAETQGSTDAGALGQLLQETFAQLEAREGQQLTGLETGFLELDEMTSGLQGGEMIIVAGRPSMGKTAFALNIAEHVAATNKQPVAVFSLEMSRQQLAQRLLCSRSGVDSHRVRRNMLSEEEYGRLAMTVGDLADAPLFIDDSPGLSLLQLRARARRLAARHDIKAVFIDYMQLMSSPGAESRQQEVSELSRGIKALARELNVPVVCLSQLNRSPEAREGHRPRMSDLRESGSIEQDADVVMMLHREEYYHNEPEWAQENPDKVNVAEVIISKQRNGPTGTVPLHFNGNTTRFANLASTGSSHGYDPG